MFRNESLNEGYLCSRVSDGVLGSMVIAIVEHIVVCSPNSEDNFMSSLGTQIEHV